MGLPPAYLFVVRHGNRLDAADKKWHLSSPTPYDPPLTYGGFQQARQVGHQIGSILEQARIDDRPRDTNDEKQKRKRFRVVIHTSPFLRCIQTSIGLSTGLSQSTNDFSLDPFDIIAPPHGRAPLKTGKESHKSTVLRIDSYLGEWLSPEYFEHITPPPSSSLMLGTAKADLLRREDYSKHTHLTKELLPQQPAQTNPKTTGALWSSPVTSPASTISQRGGSSASERNPFDTSALNGALKEKRGYIPPRPTYAASGGGKIPDGIVADGRDECVLVDYQWDSTREPLAFGDNGELGEEWSSMHKRFRGGVEKMMKWYWDTEQPERPVSHVPSSPELLRAQLATENSQHGEDGQEEEDEDVETVVVIVSHGAGCNALIGAITHQPVLMDVGIASITMASRKATVQPRTAADVFGKEEEDPLVRLDSIYDIRLSASTEHLRNDMSTPTSGRRASGPIGGFSTTTTAAPASGGYRPRTSTYSGGAPTPILSSLGGDAASTTGRAPSVSAGIAASISLRDSTLPSSTSNGNTARPSALSSINYSSIAGNGTTGAGPSPAPAPIPAAAAPAGLWAPRAAAAAAPPSSLSVTTPAPPTEASIKKSSALLTPQNEEAEDVFSTATFTKSPPSSTLHSRNSSYADNNAIPTSTFSTSIFSTGVAGGDKAIPVGSKPGRGPVLAAPIKLNTKFSSGGILEEVDEVAVSDGGLWGVPMMPEEAERYRDLSQSKRRWTVNERT